MRLTTKFYSNIHSNSIPNRQRLRNGYWWRKPQRKCVRALGVVNANVLVHENLKDVRQLLFPFIPVKLLNTLDRAIKLVFFFKVVCP